MDKIIGLISGWITHKATDEQLLLVKMMIHQKLNDKPVMLAGDDLVVDGIKISLQVQNYIERREKLHAVKLLRDESGLGLKEAKDIVDKIENFLIYQPRYVTNK